MMKHTRRDFLKLMGKVAVVAAGIALAGPKALLAAENPKSEIRFPMNKGFEHAPKIKPILRDIETVIDFSSYDLNLKRGDIIKINGTSGYNGDYVIDKYTKHHTDGVANYTAVRK